MELTLTRNEVAALYNVLDGAKNHPTGARFRYAINRSLGHLKPVMESISESLPKNEHEDLPKYESARREILKEYSDSQEGDTYHIPPENEDTVNKALGILDKKFSEVAKVQQQVNNETDDFLADKISIQCHRIRLQDVPDDLEADLQEGLHILMADE